MLDKVQFEDLRNDARMLGTYLGLSAHLRDLLEIKGSLEVRDFESIARRMIDLYNVYEEQKEARNA
jgi:hypothetical protein